LPQRVLEDLRSHRKHQLEAKIGASTYEDSDLAFATRKGTPLDAQNIVNRHFKPLFKRAGLPLSAGMISDTLAPPCFWDAVFIRR
jgi:integrase